MGCLLLSWLLGWFVGWSPSPGAASSTCTPTPPTLACSLACRRLLRGRDGAAEAEGAAARQRGRAGAAGQRGIWAHSCHGAARLGAGGRGLAGRPRLLAGFPRARVQVRFGALCGALVGALGGCVGRLAGRCAAWLRSCLLRLLTSSSQTSHSSSSPLLPQAGEHGGAAAVSAAGRAVRRRLRLLLLLHARRHRCVACSSRRRRLLARLPCRPRPPALCLTPARPPVDVSRPPPTDAFNELREQNSVEAAITPGIGGLTTGVLALGYPEILYQVGHCTALYCIAVLSLWEHCYRCLERRAGCVSSVCAPRRCSQDSIPRLSFALARAPLPSSPGL